MRAFFLKCLLFIICFLSVERFCHKRTHGFRLHKIQTNYLADPKWETSSLDQEEIELYFSKGYHFLDSGGESYVFVSENGKWILKLFKHHHMRVPYWHRFLPFGLKERLEKRTKERYEQFYSSCKLANDHFKERTGLLYLHLNPSESLKAKLKIYDAIGAVHTLDLDKIPFALQERASMAYPTLANLVSAQELEAAKLRLNSLLSLIMERSLAGLADHDARKRNFGFVGEKAIELDLGSFSRSEELKEIPAAKKVLLLETMKLRRWIKKHHPELTESLEENVKNRLNS